MNTDLPEPKSQQLSRVFAHTGLICSALAAVNRSRWGIERNGPYDHHVRALRDNCRKVIDGKRAPLGPASVKTVKAAIAEVWFRNQELGEVLRSQCQEREWWT